jgi:DNA-binding NarL/FixJ family response regulator
MFALGVKGYLNKEIDKSELKAAIIKVSQGELIFSDISFLEDESSGKSHNVESNLILKPFEKEIFKLLTSGMSQQNIANRQLITLSAIEKVIRKVKKQFNVKSISELIHILTIRKEI